MDPNNSKPNGRLLTDEAIIAKRERCEFHLVQYRRDFILVFRTVNMGFDSRGRHLKLNENIILVIRGALVIGWLDGNIIAPLFEESNNVVAHYPHEGRLLK